MVRSLPSCLKSEETSQRQNDGNQTRGGDGASCDDMQPTPQQQPQQQQEQQQQQAQEQQQQQAQEQQQQVQQQQQHVTVTDTSQVHLITDATEELDLLQDARGATLLKKSRRFSKDENKERGNWSNKWDYLLSLAGLAIGLGNVWRFPYLCYKNGGGVFLIPYVLMLLFGGIPLFLLETSMAQFASSSVIRIYDVCPAMRGTGIASVAATAVATTYYCVIIAYPLVFIFHSFTTGTLPWGSCDNEWNTADCVTYDQTKEVWNTSSVSSSEEFFHNKVLQISPDITEMGSIVTGVHIANIIVWVVIFFIIFKGMKVFGKIVWLTTLFPFVMMFVLLVRGLSLPGASIGLEMYLKPDFSRLANIEVWADAATQIFFSLGTGWGTIYTLGSYNRFRNNSLRDAMVVPILNGLTSFVVGLVVFSVLGFMSHNTGRPLHSVTTAGPALVFVTYPEAIAMLPWAPVWAVAFFAMLFFLGIGSCFVHVETVVVSLIDHYPRYRSKKVAVTLAVSFVIYICSLLMCTNSGIYWLSILDSYSVTFGIIFAGLCEIIAFSFIYGVGRLMRDLQLMLGCKLNWYWWFGWLFTCPIVMVFILIYMVFKTGNVGYDGKVFPDWVQWLGVLSALVSMAFVPLYWVYHVSTEKGSFRERLRRSHTPAKSWGPSLASHRSAWLEYCRQCSREGCLADRFLPPTVAPPVLVDGIEAAPLDCSGGDGVEAVVGSHASFADSGCWFGNGGDGEDSKPKEYV